MYSSFRVVKTFQWDGWWYGPRTDQACGCTCYMSPDCSGIPGTSCMCADFECDCMCGKKPDEYAGDVWVVPENHFRIDAMTRNRYVVYDSSIPIGDELVKDDKYKRLTEPLRGIGHNTRRVRK